jgi:Flp pilus assembly protein TadG
MTLDSVAHGVSTMKSESVRCARTPGNPGTMKLPATLRKMVHLLSGAEEGQTLVEMGLVLPVLLVVLTGIFSFGIVLNQYLILTNAVNGGARAFALSAGGAANSTSTATNEDPCSYAATTIINSAANLTSSNLTFTIVYTVNTTGTATTYSGTGTSKPTCAGILMNPSDVVQVKAVYPVTPVMYGWASKSLSLTAQSAELVQ